MSISWTLADTSPPLEEWSKAFGGTEQDYGYSVQVTGDGGYILTGSTGSFDAGWEDVYLVKTDSLGVEEWSKTFGGTEQDYGYSVQVTGDGGYIIAGTTSSFGAGGSAVYLVKTDSSGNLEWEKTFGGADGASGHSVQVTGDGGYIIAGRMRFYQVTGDDVYLVKTDSNGILEWEQTYGGTGSDYGRSVQVTSDGGYIVAGDTRSFGTGQEDVYLVKTDSLGVEEWSKTFGGDTIDVGYSVQVTGDGGYIIAGNTASFGAGGLDYYLVKTDSLGVEEWSKTFGGTERDEGYSVQVTDDGGYIIAGHTWSFGAGGVDVYLVKTDFLGVEEWSKTYGTQDGDYGYSVQVTGDGGYIIAGNTFHFWWDNSEVYLIKLAGVTGDPLAGFHAEPTDGVEPLAVTFTDSSTAYDTPLTYSWDFGDGAPLSTEQNPVHVYEQDGVYVAELTVTDNDGTTDTATTTITVSDAHTPTMTLYAGWNLISFPVIPADTTPTTIFGQDLYGIYTWDGSGYTVPTYVEPYVGYWVLVIDDVTISVTGTTVGTDDVTLSSGWSLIGPGSTSTLSGDVFPGYYQTVTWDGQGYVSSMVLDPGVGYWALVLTETTVTLP